MKITETLYQIIAKYQIDRYYPRFRMKLQAEKIIIETIRKETEEKSKIFLVGTEETALDYTKTLIGKSRQTNCCIITDQIHDKSMWNELQQADKILLVSFHDAEKAIKLLEDHHIIFDNLYDTFLCHELIFEDEYYHIIANNYYDYKFMGGHDQTYCERGALQLDYYTLKKKYARAGNTVLKNILLMKMLFLTLYMKNFVEAKRCVEEIRHNGINESVEAAWAEITDLLEHIKGRLLQRKQEDVVWFWMDAVSFDEAGKMAYLNEMKEKSLSFNNAFTNMPFTSSTVKAVFCQKRAVVDQSYKIQKINSDSSEMISYLKGNGYHIRVISQSPMKLYFEEEREPEYYDAASVSFWNILHYMLSDDEKLFILAHSVAETHAPFLSFKMDSWVNKDELSQCGRQELDEQMEFYSSFFSEDVMRIFMSDHGSKKRNGDFLGTHHIHMDFYHRNIIPQKIDELFSILDFYPLVRQLIEEKKIDPEAVRREYVPIENLDRYNAEDIKAIFRERKFNLISSFGYVGIVSENEIYIRFSIGNEYQHNRGDGNWAPLLCVESEIENDENLAVLRKEAGIYPVDILEEEKFTFSRYLYELYSTYRARSTELINALNTYLSEILSDYEDGTVAIRTGGLESYYLHAVLADNVQRKIGVFIDFNPKCLCSSYGKRITRKETLGKEWAGIKAVILSSYLYRGILKEEALQYPAHVSVIDLYDVFGQLGYSFRKGFYYTMGLEEEDYDKIYKP